jgi:hypothetical protein
MLLEELPQVLLGEVWEMILIFVLQHRLPRLDYV